MPTGGGGLEPNPCVEDCGDAHQERRSIQSDDQTKASEFIGLKGDHPTPTQRQMHQQQPCSVDQEKSHQALGRKALCGGAQGPQGLLSPLERKPRYQEPRGG